MRDALVLIGCGEIAEALAQTKLHTRTRLLLADSDDARLDRCSQALGRAGIDVSSHLVDASSASQMRRLVHAAVRVGPVRAVVHAASLPPTTWDPEAILRANLLGVALTLREFGSVVSRGGQGLVVSDAAGTPLAPLPRAVEHALAAAPANALLTLPCFRGEALSNPWKAHAIASRGRWLRVRAARPDWRARGAGLATHDPRSRSRPGAAGVARRLLARSDAQESLHPFDSSAGSRRPHRRLAVPS